MTLSGDGTITGLVAGGLPNATVIDADLSLTANSAPIKTALNASGDAPIFACRAWVNFNGQGTVSIRASGNVSSITDNGVGDYTINFATAMQDANYSMCVGNGSFADGINDNQLILAAPRRASTAPFTVSGARLNYAYRAPPTITSFDDPVFATLAFFR